VDGNQVIRFGCHLPLSPNAARYGNLGLRHTAALGLSERSDALCIVVSEERGAISLAKGERIAEIANASALRIELESFFEKRMPLAKSRPITRWLKVNPREKMLAVLLACLLWIVFGYQRETVRRDLMVPVQYLNVPVEWILEEPRVREAKVTLTGIAQAFDLLHADSLKVSLDLKEIRPGPQEIVLTPEMVNVPSDLTVAGFVPERIKVVTSRLLPLTVPIEVLTENQAPKGYAVRTITATPAEAKILIPSRLRGKKIRVMTEPIDLSLLDVQRVFAPALRYPPDIQFSGGRTPTVRVVIKTHADRSP
jgi:hypothetical protein